MANRAGNPATSTEVIPAGHAALTAEEELGEHRPDTSTRLAGLSVAALGVVFGDIGTSPVYTFRECFNPEHGLPLDAEHVLGVLSMIFWVLIIVVAVKYVLLPPPSGALRARLGDARLNWDPAGAVTASSFLTA